MKNAIKYIAVILCIAMLFALVGCGTEEETSSTVQKKTATAPFDEDNIVARIAVVSDIHISYSSHTEKNISDNIARYARAIGVLKNVSGGKLDAVMFCGDYTSHGISEQAKTFASATKEIFTGVFGENCPKLMIGMGNHDTCWSGCMNDSEWYNLLGSYGLNTALESDSLLSEGDLHVTVKAGDRTYHMLYIETDTYATNEFTRETMNWLNTILRKLTTENPDQYIFIGTHGPVQESGVFGSDIELDAGANWATAKENLDSVLKKYPQVVIFSGHTHYTERLETSIMQKNYTALNVSALLSECYCNTSYAKYADGGGAYSKNGLAMCYYLEIDKDGNTRINRVDLGESGNAATVSGTTTKSVNLEGFDNPIATAVCGKVTLTDDTAYKLYGDAWVIPTPDTEGKFLKYYTQKRGKVDAPEFPKDAGASINKIGKKISVYFPAATSNSGTKILRYFINIYDGQGNKIYETLATGNFMPITSGVCDGTDHTDATTFLYELPECPTSSEYVAEIIAQDEYGNKSKAIRSSNS